MVESNRIFQVIVFFFALTFALSACASNTSSQSEKASINQESKVLDNLPLNGDGGLDTATFAAGCFWCVEAQFLELAGVQAVVSGYSGGTTKNPTYQDVLTGRTGHAEAVNIIFNSDSISFDELLEAFFVAHDPTQLNRQGNDVGTQYRSAIFYHNQAQKDLVNYYIKKLNDENVYPKLIVTKVEPYTDFYEAEDYHKNYYALNPTNPYCIQVIQPELERFRKVFAGKLKNESVNMN
jgi:peptide-methionine (S)-S-oxide reductase